MFLNVLGLSLVYDVAIEYGQRDFGGADLVRLSVLGQCHDILTEHDQVCEQLRTPIKTEAIFL